MHSNCKKCKNYLSMQTLWIIIDMRESATCHQRGKIVI